MLRGSTFRDVGSLCSTGGCPGVSRDPLLAPKVEKEGKSSLQKDVLMVLWVPFGQLEDSLGGPRGEKDPPETNLRTPRKHMFSLGFWRFLEAGGVHGRSKSNYWRQPGTHRGSWRHQGSIRRHLGGTGVSPGDPRLRE